MCIAHISYNKEGYAKGKMTTAAILDCIVRIRTYFETY